MMMMGDDDEMNNFLHSLHSGILRARGWHNVTSWLYFCFLDFACSLHTLLWNRWKNFAPKPCAQWRCWRPMKKCRRPVEKYWRAVKKCRRPVEKCWRAVKKCRRPVEKCWRAVKKCRRPIEKCWREKTELKIKVKIKTNEIKWKWKIKIRVIRKT